MITPGLLSVTFRKLTPLEIVGLVRTAGLQVIEWGGDIHVPPGDAATAREVRRITEDAGLAVAAYGSYYRLCVGDGPDFSAVLESAVALGAPEIRVWAGNKGTFESDEAHFQTVVAESLRLADFAQKAGIVIAFEFHGGTINDMAIHGLDLVPWLTGVDFRRVVAARTWQAGPPPGSQFRNAGQFMMELANGAGLVADVSYFAPNSHGYTLPLYWRVTLWGSLGVLEAAMPAKEITLYKEGEKAGRTLPLAAPAPGGYLDSFLRELRGQPGATLTAPEIFRASWAALKAQEAADRGLLNVDL